MQYNVNMKYEILEKFVMHKEYLRASFTQELLHAYQMGMYA